MQFDQRLRHILDDFDVSNADTVEDVGVVDDPAIDVGQRKERKRKVRTRLKFEADTSVRDVGAKVRVRQHDPFGFARGAGGVDDRGELAGQHLGGPQAICGNIGVTCGSDEGLVAKAVGGNIRSAFGEDNLFQAWELAANRQELFHLRHTRSENDFGSAVLQDIGHAVGRLVEIDGHGDAARSGNGKIGGVPFRPVGSE